MNSIGDFLFFTIGILCLAAGLYVLLYLGLGMILFG
jgi:hypothetical protein